MRPFNVVYEGSDRSTCKVGPFWCTKQFWPTTSLTPNNDSYGRSQWKSMWKQFEQLTTEKKIPFEANSRERSTSLRDIMI